MILKVFLLFIAPCSAALNGSIIRSFSKFSAIEDEFINLSDFLENDEFTASPTSGRHNKSYITKEAAEYLSGNTLTVLIPSIYAMVFIISVPLNTIAIVMFACKIRPRKPAGVYMINLALADLLFGLLLPFQMSYRFSGNNWVYGEPMCRVVTFAFYCNMYCSIILMMCISLDRFLAVVLPIRSRPWRSQKKALMICITTWLVVSAGGLPVLLSEQTSFLSKLKLTTCHDVLDFSKQRSFYLYFFPIYSFVFFFVPLVVSAICYASIIHSLSITSLASRSKKTHAVVMAATTVAVFVVCFTPPNVLLLAHYLQFIQGYSDSSYATYVLSVCVGSVSCCLDPLLYYFGSSQYQKKVVSILRCQTMPQRERGSQTGSTRTSNVNTCHSHLSSQYKALLP